MRFSVLMILLAVGVALQAGSRTRCADAEKGTQAAHKDSRLFVLTVLAPDGKALPRAPVEIRGEAAIDAAQVREGKFLRSETETVIVEANASGRVAVDLPLEAGRIEYGVEMPGFAPRWRLWNGAIAPLSPFTLQLAPAGSVAGIVVDGQGQPIEGAWVRPLRADFNRFETVETRFGQHCRTDTAGKWHYDSVPTSQGEFKVEVDHPQLAPGRRAFSRAEFGWDGRPAPVARIVLPPGTTVTGKVADERGSPIAGALIRTRLQHALREAVSGSDGVYRLRGCEPGILAIVASAKGRAIEVQEHWIGPGADPVDFRLKPGGVVRIRVVDEHGKPCPRARVHLLAQHRDADFEFDNLDREVGLDGRWEWREAPPEKIPAYVNFPNGALSDTQLLVPGNEEYLFKLSDLTVTGTVVDQATKQPIKCFRVLEGLHPPGRPREMYYEGAHYAEEGRYQVRFGDQPIPHFVRIEAEGYQPQLSPDIAAQGKTARVDFELTSAPNVEGVVLTPAGSPAAGARLAVAVGECRFTITEGEILDRSPETVDLRETDASGHFRFPPQDRDYYVVVIHPSGYAWFRPIPRSNRRRITLDPWTRVEGTYCVGGKPLGGVQMSLFAGEMGPLGDDGPNITLRSRTTTGPDGRVVFERVAAGHGQIHREVKWMPRIGYTEAASACAVYLDFPIGKVVKVDIGRHGRAVIGRLKPPRGFGKPVLWQFAHVAITPDSDNREAKNRRYTASIDQDGRFCVDDVPPGRYELDSGLMNEFAPGRLVGVSLTVPGEKIRPLNQPLDVGELELEAGNPRGRRGQ
jgi:hypothetical protein